MNTTTPGGSGAHPADKPEPAGVDTPARAGRAGGASVGRLASLGAGLLCLLAGLGMLGYLAWENFGTDVVASHQQSNLLADLRAQWKYPTVADVLGPQSAIAPLGSADALLRVPRFGRDYVVPIIEGVRGEDLSAGIGHFPGTGPGQIGNFALTAHRTTYGEPFQDLSKLRPGNAVIVETAQATYTYRLNTNPNKLVVPVSAGWVIDPVPIAPDSQAPPGMPVFASRRPTVALLTLTSSSEAFNSSDRIVAFGHLVRTVPK